MSSFGKKGESYHSVSRISVAFINLIIVRKLIYSYKSTFSQDHLRSTLGITCGRGSFAAHFGDHLRSRDHLRLGIICGTVQLKFRNRTRPQHNTAIYHLGNRAEISHVDPELVPVTGPALSTGLIRRGPN